MAYNAMQFTQNNDIVASDMLQPYINCHINYAPRSNLSKYYPSCLMMDYILHQINGLLCDNVCFRRLVLNFHPYVLRLYYGVLFWVQCLRAGKDVCVLKSDEHEFLTRFLEAFPVETLTISGPLLPLFKTLCSSQPEISTWGKVYPAIPSKPGPARRDEFIRRKRECHFMPNVPGIFALLEDLNSLINVTDEMEVAVYPSRGKHIPVTATATQAKVFGHHTFPIPSKRTKHEKWSLCSPGLQYPCEADKTLNENFAERYADFDLPYTNADDDLRSIDAFLGMKGRLSWFAEVKAVATMEALFFKDSGTMADCFPTGIAANQIVVVYQAPTSLPVAPNRSCDPASLFPFSVKLCTTCRALPEMSEAMAAMAQTHVRMFNTHPYYPDLGCLDNQGEFWKVRPVESSQKDETSYLGLRGIIRGLMKSKV